jgi:hypothetical protein
LVLAGKMRNKGEYTMNNTLELLGSNVKNYYETINEIVKNLSGSKYFLMNNSDFTKIAENDLSNGMKIYWSEMLYRAHMTSTISIIRNYRWFSGILQASDNQNIMSFAACFRGFLESSADSFDSLFHIARNLAELQTTIKLALKQELNINIVSPELEDLLIHFSHARKVEKNEKTPLSHHAKTTKQCLVNLIGTENGPIMDLYKLLCEITHPAAISVLTFLHTEDGQEIETCFNNDYKVIEYICTTYKEQVLQLFYQGTTPPILILKVLNNLENKEVFTPFIKRVNLEGIPAWGNIKEVFNSSKFPPDLKLKV